MYGNLLTDQEDGWFVISCENRSYNSKFEPITVAVVNKVNT